MVVRAYGWSSDGGTSAALEEHSVNIWVPCHTFVADEAFNFPEHREGERASTTTGCPGREGKVEKSVEASCNLLSLLTADLSEDHPRVRNLEKTWEVMGRISGNIFEKENDDVITVIITIIEIYKNKNKWIKINKKVCHPMKLCLCHPCVTPVSTDCNRTLIKLATSWPLPLLLLRQSFKCSMFLMKYTRS